MCRPASTLGKEAIHRHETELRGASFVADTRLKKEKKKTGSKQHQLRWEALPDEPPKQQHTVADGGNVMGKEGEENEATSARKMGGLEVEGIGGYS